jgi:phospholipid/cholesterol/gamma-HCH transport system permease protein
MPSLQTPNADINASQEAEGSIILTSTGDWTIASLHDLATKLLSLLEHYNNQTVQWDIANIGEIDSAGMMLFLHYHDLLIANNCKVTIIGATANNLRLSQLLREHIDKKLAVDTKKERHRLFLPLYKLGKLTSEFFHELLLFLSFFGETTTVFIKSLRHPSSIRYGAIIKNIDESGVRAIPIIILTSFLIGVVITYQGAVQLEKFGANIFIVEMIGISLTRELAPLITAIVVAGRTGSAYTAQLGVMKITEEMDAMRTMGFNPHHFLVIPRILALMIALPLLVFLADIVGIFAGMIISEVHLQLSFSEFFNRLQNVLAVKHVWIGLIKAPFFAFLIGIISCFRGFQVEKNTESIGRYTTISVVNAIFLVIACDAIFSVILTEMGI